LKLAPLLAQFLYVNKHLELPGIGSFVLDPSVVIHNDDHKGGKPTNVEGVSFINNPAIKESPDLVQYISAQTGKMKALAAADLDSYLQLALQFLNIGKPFLVEGIGSLVKVKSGQFTFAPGELMSEKMKEYSAREISATSSTEESFSKAEGEKINWRKPVLIMLIVAGLGLGIWGGYTMYKNMKADNNSEPAIETTSVVPVTDTTRTETGKENLDAQKTPAGNYKFVVEVAKKERGLARFNTLKGYGVNVNLETKDSQNYKIFFVLPASASDTTRIRDSLTALYTPYWGKGFVEN
jgi:hypothetical protein